LRFAAKLEVAFTVVLVAGMALTFVPIEWTVVRLFGLWLSIMGATGAITAMFQYGPWYEARQARKGRTDD
jgi:hypothetical protein